MDWDALSAKRMAESAKKLAGLGPKPDDARRLYAEAEAQFREAVKLQGKPRTAAFLAAAESYEKAADRWPDSELEQDALFKCGESYFYADRYPAANECYERLLKDYPQTRHLDQAEAHRFAIARYWLELEQAGQSRFLGFNFTDDGQPWRDLVWPRAAHLG